MNFGLRQNLRPQIKLLSQLKTKPEKEMTHYLSPTTWKVTLTKKSLLYCILK